LRSSERRRKQKQKQKQTIAKKKKKEKKQKEKEKEKEKKQKEKEKELRERRSEKGMQKNPMNSQGQTTGSNRGGAEAPPKSWKAVVDEKLSRLHSLQFAAEDALENGDGETSLMLNLCLLGFLEGQCSTAEDRTFVSPIIRQTTLRIDASREKASASIDR
jgi:hypothetical protein